MGWTIAMVGAFIIWSFINGRWCFMNQNAIRRLRRENADLRIRMERAEKYTRQFEQLSVLKEFRDGNHKAANA